MNLTSPLLFICYLAIIGLPSSSDYLVYHKQINQALQLTAAKDFVAAQEKMEFTIEQFDFVFAKDYMIAAQLAAQNKDESKAIYFLEKAVEGGCLLSCIKAIRVFDDLRESSSWADLLLQEDVLRKNYLESIQLDLLIEFCDRYQFEQERKRNASYQAAVYDNFNRIKEIIEEQGFPGEHLIGLDYCKLAPRLQDCYLGNSKVIVTLLHYDYPIAELGETVFLEAIRAGNLHPREFALIYNYEISKLSVLYKKSFKKLEPLAKYHFNFPFGKKIDKLEMVNIDRAKFGIVAVEVDDVLSVIAKEYGMIFNFSD